MAKLVAVAKKDGYAVLKRQMPLMVEDDLTMVLQFPDTCLNCELGHTKKSDLERFKRKYTTLSDTEATSGLSTSQSEVITLLSSLIPCVGCRKSAERMLEHLVVTGGSTLDPLIIESTKKGTLVTLAKDFKSDFRHLYALLYIHSEKLHEYVETIPRLKKNKRCGLHSLECQKNKPNGYQLTPFHTNWLDLWDLISEDCKKELLTIDYQKFMEAMIAYLDKHRFCIECKAKVLQAHGLLIGDETKKRDKGFCPSLYDGIDYCQDAKHVHVLNDLELIGNLIARAEPDLLGSRRERHAKTMDIAQEEVLTCLGSFLYIRFNRLLQKLRLEEQTWKQLFYITLTCLRRNYEVELEKKQGITQLELLCAEIQQEEEIKEHKKEVKRKKKKNKKQKKNTNNEHVEYSERIEHTEHSSSAEPDEQEHAACSKKEESCLCSTNPTIICPCDEDRNSEIESAESVTSFSHSPAHSPGILLEGAVAVHEPVSTCDLGYSSGAEDSSINTIDVTECSLQSNPSTQPTDECIESVDISVEERCEFCVSHLCEGRSSQERSPMRSAAYTLPSLAAMLDDNPGCTEEGDNDCISEEVIAAFKANTALTEQRQQLRQNLKQRFDKMRRQKNCQCCLKHQ